MNEAAARIESNGSGSNGTGEAGNHVNLALLSTPLDKPKTASAVELDGIRCQFMTVTPEIASAWLHNNVKNRKLRADVVKSYARDMLNGNWVITHQGIAFNDRNELIDGQHRLSAVLEAGVPVMLLVTFGLPSKLLGKKVTTMDAVDRGTVRTIGDQLALQHDLKDANLITGICMTLARLCTDNRIRKLTVPQVLGVFDIYKDSICLVVSKRSKITGLRTSGVLGALSFAYAVQPEKVGPLFEQMNSGENLDRSNPILHLRNFLMSSNSVKVKGTVRTRAPEITLQALYCALIDKPIKSLRVDRVPVEGLKFFREGQQASVEMVTKIFDLPHPN